MLENRRLSHKTRTRLSDAFSFPRALADGDRPCGRERATRKSDHGEAQMPAYYIGEHRISDVALFDDYLAKVVPMIERYGGRYLTKAGSHEILEGDWRPNRVVIIEFPDIASIKNWYRAPEYQPLIALRRIAATDVMIMLEGL